jgi:hypothetical protein
MHDDPSKVCYMYMALTTCTADQMPKLATGVTVAKDFVVGYIEGNITIAY